MPKNFTMLKTFIKVMYGKDTSIIPNTYTKDIYSIDYKTLKQKKMTNLIFDIDNTILKVNSVEIPPKLKKLFSKIDKDFNICIVSNNKKERVLPVAHILNCNYIFEAKKPNKEAFDKALNILKAKKENTVMIGDQMLSDIVGANKYGIRTILVDPLENKYDLKTGTSRVLQNIMMKKIKFKQGNYYINKDTRI